MTVARRPGPGQAPLPGLSLCEHPPHLLAYADAARSVVVCGACGLQLEPLPLPLR